MSAQEKWSYEWTIPSKYIKIAEKELRETECRRTQAVVQMRELIQKNELIEWGRIDTKFLLLFLRKSKFNVSEAYQTYFNLLMYYQFMPQWVHNLDVSDPVFLSLIKRGFVYPLKDRDALGRKIVHIQVHKLNPDEDEMVSIIRCATLVTHTFGLDEITQIMGVIIILDFSQMSLHYLKLVPPSVAKILIDGYRFATPFRIKAFYAINMPSFVNTLMEIFLKGLKPKLRKRFRIIRSFKDLHKEIDPKILPRELGGEIDFSEMLDPFLEIIKSYESYVAEFNNVKTHFKSFIMNDESYDVPGSFRKLEFD